MAIKKKPWQATTMAIQNFATTSGCLNGFCICAIIAATARKQLAFLGCLQTPADKGAMTLPRHITLADMRLTGRADRHQAVRTQEASVRVRPQARKRLPKKHGTVQSFCRRPSIFGASASHHLLFRDSPLFFLARIA